MPKSKPYHCADPAADRGVMRSRPRQQPTLSHKCFQTLSTDLLRAGHGIRFAAPGCSMLPTIMPGQTILVMPLDGSDLRVGDIVLYATDATVIVHRIVGILRQSSAMEYEPLRKAFHIPRPEHQAKPSKNHAPLPPAVSPQSAPLCSSFPGPQATRAIDLRPGQQDSLRLYILRGDAASTFDDPVPAGQIFGKVTALEKNGRRIDPYSLRHQLACRASRWASRLKSIFC